jgi:hypothetical protein
MRKLRLLIAVALAVLAAGSLIAIPLTELIYQERDRIAGEIKAFNKECWGRSKTRGPDGTSDISHDPWAGGECWDRMLAIERDLAVQVTDINAELNELGPPRPGEEQTFADRRKEMFKLRKEVFDWMAGLGQKTAYMHLHEKTPCLRNFRRMTNPGRPTRFAPWQWKFGLFVSRPGQIVVRFRDSGNSFSVHTCPALSRTGLTSHRSAKNLCERDALPTELYPRSLSTAAV